jgi:hypothetical protein
MPSYVQLAAEPVWGAQFVPPTMNAGLLGPLRAFYGLGPAAVGSAGDNNHLYGRHRSYNWDKTSIYCTNRSYGTTDARDQGGNRNWYRAVDVGIQGQPLFDASRRMDALARSGQCPGLAEWFGTFDGINVVGWFEGRPSGADASHLFHLHVGIWNQYADDAQTMIQLYNAITGTADPATELDMAAIMIQDNTGIVVLWTGATQMIYQNVVTIEMVAHWNQAGVPGPFAVDSIARYGVAAYTPSSGSGGGSGSGATPAEVSAAVRAELDKTKLPSVPGTLGV